jgi:acyl-CoA synthetase (AMP-forming)/AMP-acid ligase II
MVVTDILARNVVSRGSHPFLLYEGRKVSYREFDRLANAAANALRTLGVGKGDRVSVALGNCVEYLALAFGVFKAGGILHPLPVGIEAAALTTMLAHAEPRVLITHAADVEHLRSGDIVVPAATTLAALGLPGSAGAAAAAAGIVALDALLTEAPKRRPPLRLAADDPALLVYTAGTTGPPKGVLLSHAGVSGQHLVEALRIACDDVILAVTPLSHQSAWDALQTALHAGGTFAFPRAFRIEDVWLLVHQTGASVLYAPGSVLGMLLARKESFLERTNRLRVILGLGSAAIRDEAMARFNVQHVADCFGSTDAGVVTITPVGTPPRPRSCGPPASGVWVRIVGHDGVELPARAVGEIAVHSPYRIAEYYRDPEATSRALRDGWFFTGDLGYLDEDGWLYFVDRKQDAIRRGGDIVSSVLIERTLLGHPKIAEVAVIGVPDAAVGEEVKAFVVATEPVTEEELRSFAEERLAGFQVPHYWEFRASLPRTTTQRVAKHTLRCEAAGTGLPEG